MLKGKAYCGAHKTVYKTVLSPILVLIPTLIGCSTATATLPKPKYESLATNTSPTIVAFGAT
jgi:hypothetical protein